MAGPSHTSSRPPLEPPIVILPSTRSGRVRKLPKAFRDLVPSALPRQLEYKQAMRMAPPPPLPPPPPSLPFSLSDPPPSPPLSVDSHAITEEGPSRPNGTEASVRETASDSLYETEIDSFGMFERYRTRPMRDPDDEQPPADSVDSDNIEPVVPTASQYTNPARSFGQAFTNGLSTVTDWFAPFLNPSVFKLMHWVYSGSHLKSHREINRLVDEVLLAPDFDREHLRDFNITREEKRLDKAILSEDGLRSEGWRKSTISIPLPKEGAKHASMDDVPTLEVTDVWNRPMTPLIKSICEDSSIKHLNLIPRELWHQDPDTGKKERVLSEIYTSDAMIEEDAKIRALPPNPTDGPKTECVVFGIILYSDGTRVANFGVASLWPIYFYVAALSKYIKTKANMFAAHHIAYIPSVSLLNALIHFA